jgi:hypothetical protein
VVFYSVASNLVSGDTNGYADVFVRDTQMNTTTRISLGLSGAQGNNNSYPSSISSDGRYVAFMSIASNLVGGDTNGVGDVFLRDTQTNTITRVSFDSSGAEGNGDSFLPSISADGRYVAFISAASNLVSGDTNDTWDVFVHENNVVLSDSDNDGLPDIWETDGLIVNVNGIDSFLDLPAMGADPAKKDIFVEIDYMVDSGICLPLVGCQSGHSHQPKPEAIAKIVQAFANAPMSNPNGSTGINLHVDYGPESEMNPITHATWGALSQANSLPHTISLGTKNANGTYDWSAFNVIKQSNFQKARATVFHYGIFAHNLGGFGNTSGISRDIVASDFIVSLGSWSGGVGSMNEQAGTFMHELGHNLGLRHGGNDHVHFKPNFLSIMNYSFQTQGLRINGHDGLFDYSRFSVPALDENNLNEPVGLNGNSTVDNYGTRYYCTSGGEKIINNVNGQVDWNCNGNAGDVNVQTDINKDSSTNTLESYNDWANLNFVGGAIGATGIDPGLPLETPVEEITQDEDALIISLYKVSIATSGNMVVPAGSTITHTFNISNLGSNPDTYTITATSEAGWANLSGVPASLSLLAGASADILITVNVPALASAGTMEDISLSVVSQTNSLIEDNATINTVVLDMTAPSVNSIVRTNLNPTSAASVNFTVTFSESVMGVDMVGPVFDDFALTTSPGISGASVTGVSGSGATYTVTVNTGSGNGTIRLDVPVSATINDLVGNPLSGLPFTNGESYTIFPYAPISMWTTNFNYSQEGWRIEKHPRIVADVNGDGNADLVGFGYNGVWVALSDGVDGFAPISMWTTDYSYNQAWRVDMHPRMTGDVNGDGCDDLIGFGYAGVWVALSNSCGASPSPSFAPISMWTTDYSYNQAWRVNMHPRMLADVNGDGNADVVGFGYNGVWVALSNGVNGFAPITMWTTNFNYSGEGWRVEMHPRMTGDVNGDGCADLIGFGYNGVWVGLSNSCGASPSSSFAPISMWTTNFNYSIEGWRVEKHPRMVADVNGDGNADLVGFGYNGVWIGLSNGVDGFDPISMGTTNFNYSGEGWRVEMHPRMAGDVNGDGNADLVGFGYNGVWVALAR